MAIGCRDRARQLLNLNRAFGEELDVTARGAFQAVVLSQQALHSDFAQVVRHKVLAATMRTGDGLATGLVL